jgi:LysR family transcriptional regulator, regulator for bpeEF and oprC
MEYMDRLNLFKTFILVAEKGSFSDAATLLNQTQSQVSKMIRRLEDDLQVTLFTRTTRQIALTEEGQRFLTHARAILGRFDIAQEELRGDKAEPKGKIRVLTSDGTGRTIFLTVLTRFLARYPFIQVEHIVSDRFLNLSENQIDVALWIGDLKDASYKARRIGLARRVTVAAPSYLKARGTPKTPEDLYHHDCIGFLLLSAYTGLRQKMIWLYRDEDGREHEIEIAGRYASDNTSIVRDAALAGLGVYQGPNYLFADAIKDGRLVEVLKEFSFDPFPIHLLYTAQDFIPLRLRVFMDFFGHEFSLDPVVA